MEKENIDNNFNNKIRNLDKTINEKLYDIDNNNIEDTKREIKKFNSEIQEIVRNIHSGGNDTPSNLLELITALELSSSNKKTSNINQFEKKKKNIANRLDNEALNYIAQIYNLERNRITTYQNYRTIHSMISQLSEGIRTFKDNIISPDDFTKNSFNFSLINVKEDFEEVNKSFQQNIEILKKKYLLEEKISDYIEESLYLGDCFVLVDNFNEGIFSNILNEENDKIDMSTLELSEKEVFLSEEAKTIFKDNEDKVRETIANFVNKDIVVGNNYEVLFEDLQNTFKEFNPNEKKKDETFIFNGSIIKKLEPEKVIKIWSEGYTFGYYVIETVNKDMNDIISNNSYTPSNIYSLLNVSSFEGGMRNKSEIIYDSFYKNIIKKIDKKFIRNNENFKDIIYNLLQQKDLYEKKIKITFVPEDKIIHFFPEEESSVEYGKSLYKDILFTAKIYLSVLMSMLMMMLLRGSDKRSWYVEVGLEEDQEALVEKVIRDVKGREIKLNDFNDVQHILKLIGMFDDYFFPTFDGQKPLDMEIIEGQKMDLQNNEFLEYLIKSAITGMGLSPAHIGYTDEIEIAKTLSMMNGKFIRRIVTMQKSYTKKVNKIFRILYKNEFLQEQGNKEKEENVSEEKLFSLENISVSFPSPATLNYTNIQDLINNVEPIIKKIEETLFSEENYKSTPELTEKIRFEFIKAVTKNLIGNINWGDYEKILESIEKEVVNS